MFTWLSVLIVDHFLLQYSSEEEEEDLDTALANTLAKKKKVRLLKILLFLGWKGHQFMTFRGIVLCSWARHYIFCISTGSTQENKKSSQHDWKSVD